MSETPSPVDPVGHLVALSQEDGKVGMMYALRRRICFQPSLAGGRIYLGTGDGGLVCLESGQDDADGWYIGAAMLSIIAGYRKRQWR
jgi:hypothetical protein